MDFVSKEQRSNIMASVKQRDTQPEKVVRKQLHALGYRFRLEYKNLPGKPDIVLPKYKTAIFIHGCFWHAHKKCKRAKLPETNTQFWKDKQVKNTKRDKKVIAQLMLMGWNSIVLWECQIRSGNINWDKLQKKIGSRKSNGADKSRNG